MIKRGGKLCACVKKNEREGKEGASETTEEVRRAREISSDKKRKTEREREQPERIIPHFFKHMVYLFSVRELDEKIAINLMCVHYI